MPLSNVLNRIKELKEERGSVVPMLMSKLPVSEIKEPLGPDDWLGVSRMPTMCPRALVMSHRGQIKLIDERDLNSRWYMDRGTGMHIVVQELWLAETGFLLGGWKCHACAHVHGAIDGVSRDGEPDRVVTTRSSVPRPEGCERCGRDNGKWTRFSFVEPEMLNHELRVSGAIDGVLHMPPFAEEIIDIKIVNGFDKMTTTRSGKVMAPVRDAPRQDHVSQIQWYLDDGGYKTGRLIYVNPGAQSFADAMIEHTIHIDYAFMHKQKESVRALRQALKDPERPIPHCPYGGQSTYGECSCVEMAVLWSSHGHRPVPA